MPLEGHQHVALDAEPAEFFQSPQLRQIDEEGRADISPPGVSAAAASPRAAGGDQVVDDEDALARRIASSCISMLSTPYSACTPGRWSSGQLALLAQKRHEAAASRSAMAPP
jgi:hypothetical protein